MEPKPTSIIAALALLLLSINVEANLNARSYQDQAKVQELKWNRESHVRSLALLHEAIKAASSSNELDVLISALIRAAKLNLTLGEYGEAARLANQAVIRAEAVSDQDRRSQALSMLLLIALTSGQTERAKENAGLIERALSETKLNAARSTAFFALGEFRTYHGNAIDTVSTFRSALSEAEASGDSELIALASLKLGYAMIRVGDPLEARSAIERSLDISRTLNDRRLQAQSLFGMGFILSEINDKQGSLEHYRASEALYPPDLDGIGHARVLNGISTVYENFGDYEAALVTRLKARTDFELARYPAGVLATLPNLGILHLLNGDLSKAEECFSTAEELALTLHSDFYRGIIAESRGRVAAELGNYADAALKYREAAEIYERLNVRLPRLSSELANVLENLGSRSTAKEVLEKALQQNLDTRDSLAAAENLLDLARINRLEGNPDLALEQVDRSFTLSDDISNKIANKRLRSAFSSKRFIGYETVIDILMDTGDRPSRASNSSEAIAYSERSKARSLTDFLSELPVQQGIESSGEPYQDEIRTRILLNAKSDRLTTLLERGAASDEVGAIEGEIAGLLHKIEEIRIAIKSQSPRIAAVTDPSAFDLEDFQATVLGHDEILLEYFVGKEKSYLWLVGKNDFEAFALPAGKQIEGKVVELRELNDARKQQVSGTFEARQARIAAADAKYAVAARELSNVILGPVADKIRGKRLIVVPDGKLNYFPISALPMPNSESDDPILLTNEVIYQPSAQTYALLKTIGQERKGERTKDLLVFSDPVFNPADERLTGIEVAADKTDEQYRFRLVESFSSLSRLPASKTEAETVSNAVGGSDLFMGFDATRERLLSTNLSDYKVVHLATHGFLDPERPELSSLVFSRYDQTGKQIDESIRMHDIYSMKLNADLVVLSACQTGTGKEIKGEGVMGLNTAFLQAGARSVVSTLWQVEDNAANQLMKEFYGRMVSDGMSPSAALRAAQIKLYQDPQFRSPFFWAAFTVHGDAATATPFKRDNTKLAIGIFAAVLLGLVGFMILRRRRYRTSKV